MYYVDMDKIPKKLVAASVILLSLLCFFLWTQFLDAKVRGNITCSSFTSQPEAQARYNSDKKHFAKLDGNDRDGKVCESLPKEPPL